MKHDPCTDFRTASVCDRQIMRELDGFERSLLAGLLCFFAIMGLVALLAVVR